MCRLMSDLVIYKFRKVSSYMTTNVLTETRFHWTTQIQTQTLSSTAVVPAWIIKPWCTTLHNNMFSLTLSSRLCVITEWMVSRAFLSREHSDTSHYGLFIPSDAWRNDKCMHYFQFTTFHRTSNSLMMLLSRKIIATQCPNHWVIWQDFSLKCVYSYFPSCVFYLKIHCELQHCIILLILVHLCSYFLQLIILL